MSTKEEHNCPHCARKGNPVGADEDTLLKGWRLGLASACVFLLPLIGALAGITLLNKTNAWQIAGGCAGLVAGLLLATFITKFLKPKKN